MFTAFEISTTFCTWAGNPDATDGQANNSSHSSFDFNFFLLLTPGDLYTQKCKK